MPRIVYLIAGYLTGIAFVFSMTGRHSPPIKEVADPAFFVFSLLFVGFLAYRAAYHDITEMDRNRRK